MSPKFGPGALSVASRRGFYLRNGASCMRRNPISRCSFTLFAVAFCCILSMSYGPHGTALVAASSPFASMDTATLRSLGVSESQIEAIMREEEDNNFHDDDEYEYEFYDDDDAEDGDGVYDDAVGEKSAISEKSKLALPKPSSPKPAVNEKGNSKNDWWKVPLAKFGEREGSNPEEQPSRMTRSSAASTRGIIKNSRRKTSNEVSASVKPSLALNLILNKMGKVILSSPVVVQLVVSFAVANLLLSNTLLRQKPSQEISVEDISDELSDENHLKEAEENENNDVNADGDFKGESVPPGYGRTNRGHEHADEADDHLLEANQPKDEIVQEKDDLRVRRLMVKLRSFFRQDKGDVEPFAEESQNLVPDIGQRHWSFQRLSGIMSHRQKRPSIKDLQDEVEALKERAETAESERDAMEKEYEATSKELQDVRAQLTNLAARARYLKSQVRDNQQKLDRAIHIERQKANAELVRVREAMMTVLEKERRLMRAQVMRQAAKVRAMMKEEMDTERNSKDEEEYDEKGTDAS